MFQATEKVLALRPARVLEKLGAASRVCLINSRDIFNTLKHERVIVMACNIRIRHVIPGIMRAAEELDAVVGFELAKSEGNVSGGYTGQTPEIFFQTVTDYAAETGFSRPFFIHGDHITVKGATEAPIAEAEELIAAELEAGYTSFAIDASFNPIPDNIAITTRLAKPIVDAGLGLEVEVGEVKSAGAEATLTTVDEAVEFVGGLEKNGLRADLLAINNGSKHGNYLDGEPISIDLERTGQIYEAIKAYDMAIAQHGITGTPLSLVGRFADYGIRKGNVGTQWQNVAHEFLPPGLMAEMRAWAEENGKNIKMATKPFKERIDSIPLEYREKIAQAAYEAASEFFTAFYAEGTGSKVLEAMAG